MWKAHTGHIYRTVTQRLDKCSLKAYFPGKPLNLLCSCRCVFCMCHYLLICTDLCELRACVTNCSISFYLLSLPLASFFTKGHGNHFSRADKTVLCVLLFNVCILTHLLSDKLVHIIYPFIKI